MDITHIAERIIAEVKESPKASGAYLTRQEAAELAAWPDLAALCDAADHICRSLMGTEVDSCSIVNARSGLCGEDCKWCAQAIRHHTACETYDHLEDEAVLEAGRRNSNEGIHRLSLVTSGRSLGDHDVDRLCGTYRKLAEQTDLGLCASMGLLTEPQLRRLREAGVTRYHCNMETSRAFFPTLCTTHTPDDKVATIRAAQRAGMQVCSGGIIGMGESMEDRIDLAFDLADLGVVSVPMNILNPIPGTPLQDIPPISEEDIIRTAAVWRFILPDKAIRFAGGRMRLSPDSMRRMLRGGVNGALMGDMLTTVSCTIAQDRELFHESGLTFQQKTTQK